MSENCVFIYSPSCRHIPKMYDLLSSVENPKDILINVFVLGVNEVCNTDMYIAEQMHLKLWNVFNRLVKHSTLK